MLLAANLERCGADHWAQLARLHDEARRHRGGDSDDDDDDTPEDDAPSRDGGSAAMRAFPFATEARSCCEDDEQTNENTHTSAAAWRPRLSCWQGA